MNGSAWVKRSMIVTGSCIAALTAFTATPAIASTSYGDLNNFDVFNDTGTDCHGFEIELDDVHSTDITYTYDYNHYGTPKITEDNSDAAHPKVFVRYAAKYNSATSSFSAYTAVPATPPAATDGHQCTNPSVNFGCEHFGVGYYGAPTVVRYNWLIENPSAPGTLIHGPAVNVATPSWTYYPPAPAQVAQVQAAFLCQRMFRGQHHHGLVAGDAFPLQIARRRRESRRPLGRRVVHVGVALRDDTARDRPRLGPRAVRPALQLGSGAGRRPLRGGDQPLR